MGDFIWIFILLLCLILPVYFFFSLKYKRILENWKQLCSSYNLKLEAPKAFWNWALGDRPYAFGSIKNYTSRCDSIMRASSDMNTYSRARLTLFRHGKETLIIYQAGILSKVEKLMGLQDIQLGNNSFDEKFVVQSSNQDFAKRVLTPEIQTLLLQKNSAKAYYWLEESQFNVEISYNDLRNAAQYNDYLAVIEISLAIAKEIENEGLPKE